MADDVDPESIDALFDVLASPLRRLILYLLRGEKEVEIDRLADALGAWGSAVEHGEPATPLNRRTARILLYHIHLPKLEDAGLVEFSPDGTVAVREFARDVDDVLEAAAALETATSGPEALDGLLSDRE